MWVYLQSETPGEDNSDGLWTVGFYAPDGEWIPEMDCKSVEEAAARVSWLNGGVKPN
jgi:hypothetical protein